MPEVGLIINHVYDFIPDRSDDRFLFCPVCDPQEFFCPITKPALLEAHYDQTGHDRAPVHRGVPEMQALGAVKARVCKKCTFVAPTQGALMRHYRSAHPKAKVPVEGVLPVVVTTDDDFI